MIAVIPMSKGKDWNERIVRWIGSWLSDRRQRVVINGMVYLDGKS